MNLDKEKHVRPLGRIEVFLFTNSLLELKTFIIMAKYDLKFICSHDSHERDFIQAKLDEGYGWDDKQSILVSLEMDGE